MTRRPVSTCVGTPRAEGPFPVIEARDPRYAEVVEIDVSQLGPLVARHPRPDDAVPLGELEGLAIDQVFIGTCTNGRIEDLEIAAGILTGRQVDRFTRTIVTPGQPGGLRRGGAGRLIEIFTDAGCTVTQPGCGACIGRHGGLLAPGERAFTTMNRNFVGRMGSGEAEIYLGSPASAAATALRGVVTDPRPFLAEEVAR